MKFSITTPSYNQAKFLRRTLDSVFSQTRVELEYFVFDGGSRDGSVKILEQYADSLTYWESKPDKGQSNAINKGFARSTGDVLTWLCSDDVYTPEALVRVAAAFEAHPEVDVVYGNCGYINKDDALFRIKKAPPFSKSRLRRKDFIFQPSTFFRKRVYEEIGPLDERYHYCMDYEYWLRMAEHGVIFYHEPTVLSYMRFHDDAKSVAAVLSALLEERKMKLEYGYPWREVQTSYLYKKYIGRHMWPLKRRIAYFFHQRGLSGCK